MRSDRNISILVLLMLSALAAPAWATVAVDGVFGLTPVGESHCVAVEIVHPEGQALLGLQWFHNDELTPFPRLVLMEGQENRPPDLAETALILEELTGGSLAWGEASLSLPVTSTTGRIYAVFVFPADQERTAEGQGGGPGMGYRVVADGQGARSFLSSDGEHWMRVRGDYEVAVEAIWGVGKQAPVSLASLKAQRQEEATNDEAGSEMVSESAETPPVVDRRPLRVVPNPFNPRAEVRLYLKSPARATVKVYDLRGRLLSTLLDEHRAAGEYRIVWEGTDTRGRPVASGVYVIRATLGAEKHRQRVTLVR